MTHAFSSLAPNTTLDLHLHTNASDGRFPLEEVLVKCADGGLDVVAITDHDLPVGLEPGVHDIDGRRIRVLPGAEVSGVHEGYEYHLLVYFPRGVPDEFRTFCQRQCTERRERYEHAKASLAMNLDTPPDAEALTRLHLAHAMVDAGEAESRGDAFRRFLAHEHGHVPLLSLTFVEAIRVARLHGGLTSWAHPPRQAVSKHLETFVEAGLQGLEGYRPTGGKSERKQLRKLSRRHGLYLTGGSDWHGWYGDNPGLFQLRAEQLKSFTDALDAA